MEGIHNLSNRAAAGVAATTVLVDLATADLVGTTTTVLVAPATTVLVDLATADLVVLVEAARQAALRRRD